MKILLRKFLIVFTVTLLGCLPRAHANSPENEEEEEDTSVFVETEDTGHTDGAVSMPTQKEETEPQKGLDEWLRGRISQVGAFQAEGRSYSVMATYNPFYNFGKVYVLGDLGATVFNTPIKEHFLVVEYGAHFGLNMGVFGAEVGLGAQYWDVSSTNNLMYSLVFLLPFAERLFFAREVFIGYSYIDVVNAPTHLIKLGFGF